jgi:hypothetical protein
MATPLCEPCYSCNTDAARTFNMGDNGVYGLGALELRMADVDLNLRLSSEVKIATSEEDDHNDTTCIHRLTEQLFHGDGVWKPWVVKSHGYHIRIDLEITPELNLEDETFPQLVAGRLKQFKASGGSLQSVEHADVSPDLGQSST